MHIANQQALHNRIAIPAPLDKGRTWWLYGREVLFCYTGGHNETLENLDEVSSFDR